MWNVESRYGPVFDVFEVEGTRERRLVIGYKMGGTSKFFRLLYSQLVSSMGLALTSDPQRSVQPLPLLLPLLSSQIRRCVGLYMVYSKLIGIVRAILQRGDHHLALSESAS
jgi:hypothetical protein